MTAINSNTFAISIQAAVASTLTGLDFPSNGAAGNGNSTRFRFTGAALPPMYGTSGAGLTYLWKYRPRQQTGYYTNFFWANDDGAGTLDTFYATNSYYGFHPYPPGSSGGTTHNWEISVEQQDFQNGAVVKGVWYAQGARVRGANGAAKEHEYYWNLPATDATNRVTRTSPSSWGNTMPPSPALTFGDAPWSPNQETASGVQRGYQIYDTYLTTAQMTALSALETDAQVLAYCAANGLTAALWYLNMNPVNSGDISDKSGKGHNPAWFNGNRPAFYTTDTTPSWAQGAAGTITVVNSGTTIFSAAGAAGAGSYPGNSRELCAPWSGGAVVDIGGVPYLVVKGGGHTDGSWNGVLKFGPLTGAGSASPTWSLWFAASALGAVQDAATYSDGRQSATHTYNNLVGVGSSLYEMRTDARYQNGFSSATGYRTTDGSPVTQSAIAASIAGNAIYGAAGHWNGSIYYVGGNGQFGKLRIYSIAGNSWTSEPNGDIALNNYTSMAIDSSRGAALVTDGTTAYYWNLNTLSRRSVTAPSGYKQCLEYDADRDVFVTAVDGAAQVRELSASSLAAGSTPSWTTRSFTGTTPTASVAAGIYGRFRYVPALRGYLLVPTSTSNVWFFKSS